MSGSITSSGPGATSEAGAASGDSVSLRVRLREVGFDLFALVPAAHYDAIVPESWRTLCVARGASSVAVVGCGGRRFWDIAVASPEWRDGVPHPLDRYARRVLTQAVGDGSRVALYSDTRADQYLPMIALARAGGLGEPGRIGLLLNREFGPWMALRGVLYLDTMSTDTESDRVYIPSGRIPDRDLSPCVNCTAPCQTACHGNAVSTEGLDLERCSEARQSYSACRARCDARAACVIGTEHAYSREQLSYHARFSLATVLSLAVKNARSDEACSE